jgi:hypothetical protein
MHRHRLSVSEMSLCHGINDLFVRSETTLRRCYERYGTIQEAHLGFQAIRDVASCAIHVKAIFGRQCPSNHSPYSLYRQCPSGAFLYSGSLCPRSGFTHACTLGCRRRGVEFALGSDIPFGKRVAVALIRAFAQIPGTARLLEFFCSAPVHFRGSNRPVAIFP